MLLAILHRHCASGTVLAQDYLLYKLHSPCLFRRMIEPDPPAIYEEGTSRIVLLRGYSLALENWDSLIGE